MSEDECKGCSASVRLSEEEVERILAEYLRDHPADIVDDATYQSRLAICGECDDLQYATTCRHCGCLVPVMAKLSAKQCPRPGNASW